MGHIDSIGKMGMYDMSRWIPARHSDWNLKNTSSHFMVCHFFKTMPSHCSGPALNWWRLTVTDFDFLASLVLRESA